MSSYHSVSDSPIINRLQLADVFASGEKSPSSWLIGTEHEKFGFCLDDLSPPPFDGERGIEALLKSLTRFHWQENQENGRTIGLSRQGASISLEPAGQLELSGAAVPTIHATYAETHAHLREVNEVAAELGLGFLAMGFQPKWARNDMPWMPKERYRIMRRYMPIVGQLGLDMMTRTCTVQVNLDYANEDDMIKKFRVALALQPVVTALFADSPFTQGRPNGYLSYRSHVWTQTDPQRTGMLDFVFEPGFGYERYVDYLWNVPLYFVHRDGRYYDVAGKPFSQLVAGQLSALPGVRACLGDWLDHMTTAFPEVRMKKYLEMRGADCGSFERICALPALWVGLLYNSCALDAAWDLTKRMSREDRHALRQGVPSHALALPYGSGTVRDLAKEMLAIAREGLRRRACLNDQGQDESCYLDVLDAIVLSGVTPAEEKLRRYVNRWGQQIDPIFNDYVLRV